MRLTGGEGKGRRLLDAPDHVRPTSGRIREQLFFMLLEYLEDANVLDLFAGTGSLGIEALARGARQATFVDKDRESIRVTKSNLDRCKFTDRANVIQGDVFRLLRRPFHLGGPFDLVLADPPYREDTLAALLESLRDNQLMVPDGVFIYETQLKEKWVDVEGWTMFDKRTIGGTVLYFVRLSETPTQ